MMQMKGVGERFDFVRKHRERKVLMLLILLAEGGVPRGGLPFGGRVSAAFEGGPFSLGLFRFEFAPGSALSLTSLVIPGRAGR